MWHYIRDLNIPPDLSDFLVDIIDTTQVSYISGFNEHRTQWVSKEGRSKIIIDPHILRRNTHLLPIAFHNGEPTAEILRALTVYVLGHEFGHALHNSLSYLAPIDIMKSFAPYFMSSYPIKLSKDYSSEEKNFYDLISKNLLMERIAHRFGLDIYKSFGFRHEILEDYYRMNATKFFGSGFSFEQLQNIFMVMAVHGLNVMKDDIKGQDFILDKFSKLYLLLLIDPVIYQAYPLDRAKIERIFKFAWQAKKKDLVVNIFSSLTERKI